MTLVEYKSHKEQPWASLPYIPLTCPQVSKQKEASSKLDHESEKLRDSNSKMMARLAEDLLNMKTKANDVKALLVKVNLKS